MPAPCVQAVDWFYQDVTIEPCAMSASGRKRISASIATCACSGDPLRTMSRAGDLMAKIEANSLDLARTAHAGVASREHLYAEQARHDMAPASTGHEPAPSFDRRRPKPGACGMPLSADCSGFRHQAGSLPLSALRAAFA